MTNIKRIQQIEEQSPYARKYRSIQNNELKRIEFLLDVCHEAGNERGRTHLIDFLCSKGELFPAESLWDIQQSIQKKNREDALGKSSIQTISRHLGKVLKRLLSDGCRKEDDWSITKKAICNCDDCKQLKSFLNSKDKSTISLPLRKERRQHLHNQIDMLGVPVSHNTLRKGSPYTLVLEKHPYLFTKDKRIFEQRAEMLESLQGNPSIPPNGHDEKRIGNDLKLHDHCL